MKSVVILFAGQLSAHAYDKIFDNSSAVEKTLAWAKKTSEDIVIFSTAYLSAPLSAISAEYGAEIVSKDAWTCGLLAEEISKICESHGAAYAVYSWADTPFLNEKLTSELIAQHEKYQSEYTFADGFPYGVAPEIIDAGCARILSALTSSGQNACSEKPVCRDSIFSIMKGDINSFEIETFISEKDYRLLRLNFEASSKINAVVCERLYEKALQTGVDICDIYAFCDLAEKSSDVIRSLPSFYNVQITGRYNHVAVYNPIAACEKFKKIACLPDMGIEQFRAMVAQIADFSEEAVVSLSAWGEPLLHPLFWDFVRVVLAQKNLTVLIETDGLGVQSLQSNFEALTEEEKSRFYWIVLLDAVDSTLYSKIQNCGACDFDAAVNAVPLLEKYFDGRVYPQMTRMKANEPSLEAFFRYWHDKGSPSKGELIIQKYDRMCGDLPDEKSADLSPLERNPCWHLRRDMVILADGSVPLCRDFGYDSIVGNVFEESVQSVWEKSAGILDSHLTKNYPERCRKCDEYYTFNF